MILHMYSLYNRLVGAYYAPTFENLEANDKAESMNRVFKLTKDAEARRTLLECDLFYLGKFNDKDGSFELLSKPQFLCSFQEEGVLDGKVN